MSMVPDTRSRRGVVGGIQKPGAGRWQEAASYPFGQRQRSTPGAGAPRDNPATAVSSDTFSSLRRQKNNARINYVFVYFKCIIMCIFKTFPNKHRIRVVSW